ncbi:AraC family transcriptional regulator [Rhodococcus sp. ABRD24]|uniref:AraC family transcriptional regulator n=1 Tax=Rhodococcus sp. ABRD24 TaxID=2507582 RepID=UPI00103F3DD3|nr:AraC family transcriptional regulator [Rhodococcus sp. ABRD24]QBJ96358.1 AraC family transcriptional regulator [Rhodococcus sp. ABRD24]
MVDVGEHNADVLSSILSPLRLHGAYHSDWHLHHAWAVQGRPEPRALIHYMLIGTATITFGTGERHHLAAGDLAMFPRGAAHVVSGVPCTNAPYISDLLPERAPGSAAVLTLGDPSTPQIGRMLCAGLDYDSSGEYLLYRMLPDVLIVRRDRIATQPLLAHLLDGILAETNSPGNGTEAVQLRSFELAYLLGLRLALHDDIDTHVGRALRHPRLGDALIAINMHYSRPWTVQSLADLTGLPQSTFAREFTTTIGRTPASYLRDRRLLETRRLLECSADSLERIAVAVGYGSTIGLHQAFTREFGVTPGQYRRTFDESADDETTL